MTPRASSRSTTPRSPRAASAPRSTTAPKLQRWLDLLAALLRRSSAASLEELALDVPAYWARLQDHEGAPRRQESALSRMFERDKLELRQLGVPLAVQRDDRGNERLYRLERRDFFLPFLTCVFDDGAVAGPAPRPRHGRLIGGLDTLRFTPDELAHVVRAMRRVAQLGDGALAEAVTTAIRTLSHDLAPALEPLDGGETVVAAAVDPAILGTIHEALAKRLPVIVDYHSIGRDVDRRRQIEPLGLAFSSGHWYCIARDPEDGRIKQFRVARMRQVAVVSAAAPIAVPDGFALERYATRRRPWELGDGDATTVRVVVAPAVADRWTEGRVVRDRAHERDIDVRRLGPFLRWILTFGGEVQPIAPTEVVAAWRVMLQDTIASYRASRA